MHRISQQPISRSCARPAGFSMRFSPIPHHCLQRSPVNAGMETLKQGCSRTVGLRNTLEPDPDNTGVGSFGAREIARVRSLLFQSIETERSLCLPIIHLHPLQFRNFPLHPDSGNSGSALSATTPAGVRSPATCTPASPASCYCSLFWGLRCLLCRKTSTGKRSCRHHPRNRPRRQSLGQPPNHRCSQRL